MRAAGRTHTNSDATGAAYAFEKGATKASGGEGWADVWRRGRFAWEYKGKHRDLKAAHRQLLQYAGALENPPLLVTCDIERIVIRTNWTNAVSERHEVRLEELTDPQRLAVLKYVFSDPDLLRPEKTRAALTAQAAAEFAELAGRLRARGNNPQIVAHFVNRLVFCLFADDVGLLPPGLFERMLDASRKVPARFESNARLLFKAMAIRAARSISPPLHGSMATCSMAGPPCRWNATTLRSCSGPRRLIGRTLTRQSWAPFSSADWTRTSAASLARTTHRGK